MHDQLLVPTSHAILYQNTAIQLAIHEEGTYFLNVCPVLSHDDMQALESREASGMSSFGE